MIAATTRVVIRLGSAQTLAWASSYYLPAMLAEPMARDLGLATSTIFAAFSAALVMSALFGPRAGRFIDRLGGRPVLACTSLIFALGLVVLGLAQGPVVLFLAWLILGVAMSSGLYEAAFAALVGLYGSQSRAAITGITLIAGFASTVGWPLSAFLEWHLGWRGTCFIWAALHLTLGLALNLGLPRLGASGASRSLPEAPAVAGQMDAEQSDGRQADAGPVGEARAVAGQGDRAAARDTRPVGPGNAPGRRVSAALAFVFAATWFISTAMAAHLPGILQAGGASLAVAVTVGALIGPSQVGARLLEFGLLRKFHPLISARLAALLHPLGAAVFCVLGTPAAAAFGILHGAGNGILTIAKGTLPLVIFGPGGYGQRQGVLMVPARIAQALAPWLFGLCLETFGIRALWLTGAVGIAAALVLLTLPAKRAAV